MISDALDLGLVGASALSLVLWSVILARSYIALRTPDVIALRRVVTVSIVWIFAVALLLWSLLAVWDLPSVQQILDYVRHAARLVVLATGIVVLTTWDPKLR